MLKSGKKKIVNIHAIPSPSHSLPPNTLHLRIPSVLMEMSLPPRRHRHILRHRHGRPCHRHKLLNHHNLNDLIAHRAIARRIHPLVLRQRHHGGKRRLGLHHRGDLHTHGWRRDSLGNAALDEHAARQRGLGNRDRRACRVRERGDRHGVDAGGGGGAVRDYVRGAVVDGNAAGEAGEGAGDIFGGEGGGDLDQTLLALGLGLDGEERAVLDAAGGRGAGFDCGLQEGLIPAHDEVGVVPVAGRVAVRQDKLAGDAREGVGVPDDLIEEAGEADGEVGRAGARRHQVGVGDVAALVLARHVLAVPA